MEITIWKWNLPSWCWVKFNCSSLPGYSIWNQHHLWNTFPLYIVLNFRFAQKKKVFGKWKKNRLRIQGQGSFFKKFLLLVTLILSPIRFCQSTLKLEHEHFFICLISLSHHDIHPPPLPSSLHAKFNSKKIFMGRNFPGKVTMGILRCY